MESHASKRDGYGIPIICRGIPEGFIDDTEEEVARTRIRREERRRIRAKTESLRELHYTADFLENWMFGNTLLAKRKGLATRTDQHVEDLSRTVDDEIECLEAHRKGTLSTVKRLFDLQCSFARYQIGAHIDYLPCAKALQMLGAICVLCAPHLNLVCISQRA